MMSWRVTTPTGLPFSVTTIAEFAIVKSLYATVTSTSCSSAGNARPITSPTGLCTMSAWSNTACMTATSLIAPTTSLPRTTGSCEML